MGYITVYIRKKNEDLVKKKPGPVINEALEYYRKYQRRRKK